jgi:hypothetical protein
MDLQFDFKGQPVGGKITSCKCDLYECMYIPCT